MDRITTEGPLLGVFREAEFDQTTFVLEPGDTLVVYTDGFESAFPERGEGRKLQRFNLRYIDQIREMVDRVTAGTSLEESMLALDRFLDVQAGSLHQVDDVTALAIRVPAVAASAAA
jgi:serine phosphatase RsbU (regulator of sigma subunit)